MKRTHGFIEEIREDLVSLDGCHPRVSSGRVGERPRDSVVAGRAEVLNQKVQNHLPDLKVHREHFVRPRVFNALPPFFEIKTVNRQKREFRVHRLYVEPLSPHPVK